MILRHRAAFVLLLLVLTAQISVAQQEDALLTPIAKREYRGIWISTVANVAGNYVQKRKMSMLK